MAPSLPPSAPPPAPAAARRRRRDLWLARLVAGLMWLPFPLRVRLAGAAAGRLAPLTRLPARVAAAVRHFRPDLPEPEVARIARAVPANLARMAVENFSGAAFGIRAAASPVEGPGLSALEAARAAGRPAILVTAHFGNYDAARAALRARGFDVAGVYRPFPDPVLNARYVAAIGAIGQPLFPTTREGMAGMLRHLRGGGVIGILVDLDRPGGVLLDFLGRPTRTVLSPAEMALRHGATLVPVWGVRQPDGSSFRIRLDAPIPHGEPEAMAQAMNDAFAAMVRAHPEQWVWWHNRRKRDHP